MVECFTHNEKIKYLGTRKPSVDTPVQLELYKHLHEVNYMIHGPNEILGAPETENYYPCGDMREVPEILKLIRSIGKAGMINLKNHGFLIYANTIDQLKTLTDNLEFKDF